MSCATLAQSSSTQDHWITPEKQLEILGGPITEKVCEASKLIPDLAKIVAQYAIDSRLTDWYTALERIGYLPHKIPPLPAEISQILDTPCPSVICSKKKIGTVGKFFDHSGRKCTPYTIGEGCTFTLIPDTFKTMLTFKEAMESYRERQLRTTNPAQLQYFESCLESQENYTDEQCERISFEATHWELQTKEILPGSQYWSFERQKSAIGAFAETFQRNLQIPEIQGTLVSIFLRKIAIWENQIPEEDLPCEYRCILDPTQKSCVTLKPLKGFNVEVHRGRDMVGIGAMEKFQ